MRGRERRDRERERKTEGYGGAGINGPKNNIFGGGEAAAFAESWFNLQKQSRLTTVRA